MYVNVEAAHAMREDVGRAMRVILGELASRAVGDELLYDRWPDILDTFGEGSRAEVLNRWCEGEASASSTKRARSLRSI